MSRREWQRVRLGSYCSKIGSGSTPRGGGQIYQSEGTAFIRSQNVYNGVFAPDGLAYPADKEAEHLDGVTVQERDLLLNITGDSVARCCQVPETTLPARVSQHVAIIRPLPEEFDARFLMFFLISPWMQSTMLSLSGSGGTRKALTKEMIQGFEVPKPPLLIQRDVAAILSTGFAVITPTAVPSTFMYFATTTDMFVGYLANHARGAAYSAVVASDFERAEILVPPKRLLTTFDDIVEPTFSQVHNLHQQHQKLRAARDLLLPRLMSGEITV